MPEPKLIQIEDLKGGWNSNDAAGINDNDLALAENFYYDEQQVLTTRRGIANFGNPITGAEDVHSLYNIKFSDGTRHLLCAANTATDTTIFRYNSVTQDWDSIKTGLTKDLRLCFITFKDEIYWTNGTDNVMSYDGTTVSEHALVEKGKYLVMFNDTAYMGCIQNDKSVIFYSNTNPLNLKTAFPNFVVIEEDNGQDITGLQYQAGLLLIGKEGSAYSYDVVLDIVKILDYSGGVASHRSWKVVENDTIHLSKRGVFGLIQRQGTTGSLRSLPLTNNLQLEINSVGNFEIACAYYSERKRNYYLAVDIDAGGRNKGLLVRSTTVGHYNPTGGWTSYIGINVNDIIEYEDENDEVHLLGANVFDNQVIAFETGYDDLGTEIACRLHFKEFDFKEPTRLKTYPFVDFQGLSSTAVVATLGMDIDGRSIEKTFTASDFIGTPAGVRSLGEEELGTYPIGGGEVEKEMPVENFEVRVGTGYDSGRRIQPKIECNILNGKLQIKKVTIAAIAHPIDIFPSSKII